MLRVLLVLIAVPVLAYGALALAVGRDRVWSTLLGPAVRVPVDFASLVPPATPNHHLVCPPGRCAAPHADSPVFAVPADRLRAVMLGVLERTDAVVLSASADRIEAEVRTPVLRFPDHVSIQVIALDAEHATLALYSRSVYGYGDFGTNKRRVDGWLAAVRLALG